MRVTVVIPARLDSKRLPRKALAKIGGVPMIVRTWRAARGTTERFPVVVATDSAEIAETCDRFEIPVVMTSPSCATGTDRVAEASQNLDADIFVNVQGDEPFITGDEISAVVRQKVLAPESAVNAWRPFLPEENPSNPSLPKIVCDENGLLLYASRLAIPGNKTGQLHSDSNSVVYRKQVCVYAFNRDDLAVFTSGGRRGQIEEMEDIEIIRFVELGRKVLMVELAKSTSFGIDTAADLQRANRLILSQA